MKKTYHIAHGKVTFPSLLFLMKREIPIGLIYGKKPYGISICLNANFKPKYIYENSKELKFLDSINALLCGQTIFTTPRKTLREAFEEGVMISKVIFKRKISKKKNDNTSNKTNS